GAVEARLGDAAERGLVSAPRIGEEHVDAAGLAFHRLVEPVEISEVRNVTLYAHRSRADVLHRPIELGLAATGDEDARTFGREPLRGGEADAAVAPGDHGDLSLELFRHGVSLLGLRSGKVGEEIPALGSRGVRAPRLPVARVSR